MRALDYGKMGLRIRQVRKAKGWSQDELAKRCGISMSFLGHIERGTRIMSMETFANICSALDAGADELLWGVPDKTDDKGDKGDKDKNSRKKTGRQTQGAAEGTDKKKMDSYAMYVKIMKSVAEIMNEA